MLLRKQALEDVKQAESEVLACSDVWDMLLKNEFCPQLLPPCSQFVSILP